MGEALVISDKRHGALEAAPAMTPMQELQLQIIRIGDIEKLKELRAIEKEWREDQAKHAYIEAMASFKSETIRIVKDRENLQYSKAGHKAMYVSLGNLVQTVTPYLSKHGLSVTWADPVFGATEVKVICQVSHAQGHSEQVSFVCPFDTSGSKNPIQSRKSAITYARAITYEMALGLAATEEANRDDDGNGVRPADIEQGSIDEGVAADHLANIEAAADVQELETAYFSARDAAQAAKDKKAATAFGEAKNKRYRQIAKASHA